jgi:hypothetical protein
MTSGCIGRPIKALGAAKAPLSAVFRPMAAAGLAYARRMRVDSQRLLPPIFLKNSLLRSMLPGTP